MTTPNLTRDQLVNARLTQLAVDAAAAARAIDNFPEITDGTAQTECLRSIETSIESIRYWTKRLHSFTVKGAEEKP